MGDFMRDDFKRGDFKRHDRRGDALVEFTLTSIPVLLLAISIFEMSLLSWKFHSMAYAVDVAGRYACGHGRDCTKKRNTHPNTVRNVVSVISRLAAPPHSS